MKLGLSEIDYRSLFDNMIDGLAYCKMIFDADGLPADFIYITVNENFEKLTGLKEAEGKKVTELIPGIRASNSELFEIYGKVSLTGKPEKFETYVQPLGRWFSISVYSPKKNFFVAVFQNITDRKEIEKDLESAKIAARNVLKDLEIEKKKIAETSAKEEAILAGIADGCIAVNEKGEIILINQTAQKMLGYTQEESIGKLWHEILHREDESGNPISPEKGAIRAALSTTTTTTTTTSSFYLRKDRTKFPISRTVSPIILEGKVIGAVNIFRDITREKEIDREKSEFVSLASHQLRTPLTGIEWTIELFSKKEKLTEEGRKYLDYIHYSAVRLSNLIKLLLNVSRIESSSMSVVSKPLDLVELINENMREHQALCDRGKISFIFSKHPQKLIATTDKNLIGYIIQNLVSNAINYTPTGGKVEMLLEEKKDSLQFRVQDTGIGIPKKEQEHIFKKFARASNASIVKPDGTGLGLYIASEAAKLLGGKIWFESDEGKGSTFFVQLPLMSPDRAGNKELVLEPK